MKNIMIGTWAWGTGINGSSMIFGKKQNPEILKEAFEEAVKLLQNSESNYNINF